MRIQLRQPDTWGESNVRVIIYINIYIVFVCYDLNEDKMP